MQKKDYTITTPQLLLRPFHPNDVDAIKAIASHPQWGLYAAPSTEPYSRWDAELFITRAIQYNMTDFPHFAMVRDNQVIGGVSLKVEPMHEVAELLYFMSADHWGKGVGNEAVEAVVAWGFRNMMINKVFAQVDTRNDGRIQILIKLGMQREGTLRSHKIHLNETVDMAVFGVLRHEWDTHQKFST